MNVAQIGIVIGTIREGRFGAKPATWIYELAAGREDMECEVLDLRDYPLPLYGADSSEEQKRALERWRQKTAQLDGYIFITAEYNHSISGALKNALDHASDTRRKPAAFVGYGGVGGARAVEQLRLICIELQLAPTKPAVHIAMEPYRAVTEEGKALSDFDFLNQRAEEMLDDLAWWTQTLKVGREAGRLAMAR